MESRGGVMRAATMCGRKRPAHHHALSIIRDAAFVCDDIVAGDGLSPLTARQARHDSMPQARYRRLWTSVSHGLVDRRDRRLCLSIDQSERQRKEDGERMGSFTFHRKYAGTMPHGSGVL